MPGFEDACRKPAIPLHVPPLENFHKVLSKTYPELIPYLPLKLAVFAEDDQMLAVSFNPQVYGRFFHQQELKTQFARWKADLDSVMADLREIHR